MRICYFGIYNPTFGRNKIYIDGLRKNGHEVIECRDSALGFRKYINLWRKHRILKNKYDVLIVGYPGHVVVTFARLISRKKIIVDALGSLLDAEVHSHNPSVRRRLKSFLVDWLMISFSHVILLESEAQKKFFIERFGLSPKYKVLYTGADDMYVKKEALHKEKKDNDFLVLFRGSLTPESGIMHILKAAELLKHEQKIRFRVMGRGALLHEVEQRIRVNQLYNVELIIEYLSDKDLVRTMSDADLMLGQFEDNPRLNRTIPHKAYEAFALGIPYLTGDAGAIREIMPHEQAVFTVPLSDARKLASKIQILSQKPELRKEASETMQAVYKDRFTPYALAQEIEKIIVDVHKLVI